MMRPSKGVECSRDGGHSSLSQNHEYRKDHEEEMERLRSLLRNSTTHLADKHDAEKLQTPSSGSKRKRNRKPENNVDDSNKAIEEECITGERDQCAATYVLSHEMQDEMVSSHIGNDGQDFILPPRKKKKSKTKQPVVQLTPQEIRQAKLAQKKHSRKLQKLAEEQELKQKRADLYSKLQENAISSQEAQLLSSSSTLGKRISKKEALRKALQKERAGIELTLEERNLLYADRTEKICEDSDTFTEHISSKPSISNKAKSEETMGKTKKIKNAQNSQMKEEGSPETGKKSESFVVDGIDVKDSMDVHNEVPEENDEESKEVSKDDVDSKQLKGSDQTSREPSNSTEHTSTKKPTSFAAQMMSSVLKLKQQSTEKKLEQEYQSQTIVETEHGQTQIKHAPYIPTNPAILKTAAALKLEPRRNVGRRVFSVNRPKEVQETRQDLPVCGMEYEIVDAIRNNDVVIICSETGSGKSTQIPQFLFEAGFSQGDDSQLCIGVTQPRRVAAISTAKRICYEMGQGSGNSIPRESRETGNLVAYQTRYESAGLGSCTQIKFMTDGILLQEIQSDLLLRKYSVIVLDEAHERNLNTDVLLGLLSVALPLRRKAATQEGSNIRPLKLVVMSATLRVDDFTKNDKLFPTTTPMVVTVPGRTFPVTVHHSKVTEMEEYENVAFQKVCKIHRKLPPGGILVFLTGKQEIVRMVNGLKTSFQDKDRKRTKPRYFSGANDVSVTAASKEIEAVEASCRDMDDDELDGDLYQDHDDFDTMENEDIDEAIATGKVADDDSSIPQHVHVLPLYSMLAVEEQAKVFTAVPEGHRLIVVATNMAETSLTIPGISYVVDSGRQKCRNYHPETGVASYDVMWISKAAADQRAGRAGRTGPGHCYRLYSSTMYSQHMSAYALPEVLTRPLEDVVLSMKALKVRNVKNFPFPTPPSQDQIDAAVTLLADIGCVDLSTKGEDCDGEITQLGVASSRFPVGVRYGKMLTVSANAGVLDYAIVLVAVLSQSSPFLDKTAEKGSRVEGETESSHQDANTEEDENQKTHKKAKKWMHKGGDAMAAMLAAGAYAYVGRGAGGASERAACRAFCKENGLDFVVMDRIHKMRIKLARLVKTRLSSGNGLAAMRGAIQSNMPPPNALQEKQLIQVLTSGLLDNVAVLAPPGRIVGDHPHSLRSAYLACSTSIKEPLFMDRTSVLYSRDSRRMPEWVCYQSVVRSVTKDGNTRLTMKSITPVNPSWLGTLSVGSRLLSLGIPLASPLPSYDPDKDAVLCSVATKFGSQGLEIPPVRVQMYNALQSNEAKRHSQFRADDSFRWFARFLLEGKVLPELQKLPEMLNDEPAVLTRKTPVGKAALLVSALSSQGIDSAAALRKHWAEVDKKFLFKQLSSWTLPSRRTDMKRLWMDTVKNNIAIWKQRS